jgi:hypothetical protein
MYVYAFVACTKKALFGISGTLWTKHRGAVARHSAVANDDFATQRAAHSGVAGEEAIVVYPQLEFLLVCGLIVCE